MLTWFPSPYPDELFYSVLCRYYLSSGIKEHYLVKKQLFGTKAGVKMATLYPNATIHAILSQLPEKVFDGRDMILHHTPFLYYARMYPQQEREALLDDLLQGRGKTPTHLWKTFPKDDYALRYCPLCIQEDTKIYGEPYYHVEHQIPLSSVCVRHRCRLKQIAITNPRLSMNNRFFPLSTVETDREPDMDVSPAELRASGLVREYWRLPASISPPAHNNLYQTLLNSGYMTIVRQNGPNIDRTKLYAALCGCHGAEAVKRVFGENISGTMMNRIKTWEQLLPDRYILIQAMLGLHIKTVFGPGAHPGQAPGEDRAHGETGRILHAPSGRQRHEPEAIRGQRHPALLRYGPILAGGTCGQKPNSADGDTSLHRGRDGAGAHPAIQPGAGLPLCWCVRAGLHQVCYGAGGQGVIQ